MVHAVDITAGNERGEHQVPSAVSMMDQLKSNIEVWNSVPESPTDCLDHLQTILKTVEDVKGLTGSEKHWVDVLCTNEFVSGFLLKVVEMEDRFLSKDVSLLRFQLKKLVAHVGRRDFPCIEKIIKWAEATSETADIPTMFVHAGIQNIPDLVVFLKERFIPMLQVEHAKYTDSTVHIIDNINRAATVDMAVGMSQLLEYLQSSGDTVHLVFFMKAVLLQLEYDWSSMEFRTLLTMDRLKRFVQFLDKEWANFLKHQDRGKVQLESYLVQMSIASGQFQNGQQRAEDDFSNLVKGIRQVLSPQLNAIINRLATSSPYNWKQLVQLTSELAQGNMAVVDAKEFEIADLNERYRGILDKMGLCKYHPSKITMLHAITIRTYTDEMHDLPWKIIQKLLMIDFYARDHPVSACNQSCHVAEQEQDVEDMDAFLQESHTYDDGERGKRKVSTLDIIVVIFGCCDNFLKQVLAHKLFVCKLAIPFLYPFGSLPSIAMSLWALRTIIVDWCNMHNKSSETPVTDTPFPIVTFVRLGSPPFSKSKLMNDVLCDQAHDTFLNHDCLNGTVERRVTEGLVECSWFIQSGPESKVMPRTTMFLNLRGDASSHQKQMRILSQMSSAVVVIAGAKDLASEPHTEAFKQISKAAKQVILLLIRGLSGNSKQHMKAERQACIQAVGKDALTGIKLISSTKDGAQMNASEMRTEVRTILSEILTECDEITIEECASMAEKEGVTIDELDIPCVQGKLLAEKVIQHMEGREITDCKGNLLPLQGTEWVEYSKLLKKQHRASAKAGVSSAYQADQLKQEMDRLRKRQVGICSKLTPFIKDFMTILGDKDEEVSAYFLHWMKLLIDRKSRLTLPGLRRQYHDQWTKFQQFQRAKNDTDGTSQEYDTKMKELKVMVDQAEHDMSAASLGLENLFRELGQMYEAIHECSEKSSEARRKVEYLPGLVARLMVKGTPLELVDGDAANVPTTWIRAVLEKLEDIVGKEKRLFVLSVLGIQSSGKSTLLNTMFGLQFAVSAGRCTKGAYMQLVPVDRSANLPFDYIVVIDTEGLRAQELAQDNHSRDNELATLVIGLGDVTMMNIKGENHSEMKDILQIAVHAFLRMNIVNKHIKNHRTSVFVHQNVPAANAKEMLIHGCHKLQESLDAMAKEAADSENIADIHSFSQIIKFDVNEHVWYFSDLWHGDPPMAPANPGYSEKVDFVKLRLLEYIAKPQTSFLTISDLSVRLEDLWKGILADDFVFSFRNSLEMKAYNSLERTYYALEWKLHTLVMIWVQKTAGIKIKKSENMGDLELCLQQLLRDLKRLITKKVEEIKIDLKDYFENSNLPDILIQWQHTKMNALSFAAEEKYNEVKSDLISMKDARRIELLQTEKWASFEIHIMENAKKLAETLKRGELTDKQMEEKFEEMWVPIVNQLASKVKVDVPQMDVLMEEVLTKKFHSRCNILREELERQPLYPPPKNKSLLESIQLDFVTWDDLSLKTSLFEKAKALVSTKDRARAVLSARSKILLITQTVLENVIVYLNDLCSQDIKFQQGHAKDVIQIITKIMDAHNEHNSKDSHFMILPRYVVKLAAHISRYCVREFSLMQDEHEQKHGVVAKLEAYKKSALSLFKNMVKQSTEEVIAADLFSDQLRAVIEQAVNEAIPMKVMDEVMGDFEMTKRCLIVKMMDDLACKGNFDEYASYIRNAKTFALKWITQYTNKKVFTKKSANETSRYGILTKSHIQRITRCIAESVEHATSEVDQLSDVNVKIQHWIQTFCKKVEKEIAIPTSSLKHMAIRNVADFGNLQRLILNQLDVIEKCMVEEFIGQTDSSVRWNGTTPYLQILDKLWGCPEQCPFCNEPCAHTTIDHYSKQRKTHTCTQHRPIGIRGSRWKHDGNHDGVSVREQQLQTEVCNFKVQIKNAKLECGVCQFKCRDHNACKTTGDEWVYHEFMEYKTYLQEWDISPDPTNSVSKYWQWFMANYQDKLKDMYRSELPDIPVSWHSITKQMALDDLRIYHH